MISNSPSTQFNPSRFIQFLTSFLTCLGLFSPLERPSIHSGDDIKRTSIPHRKGRVKALSFLTGFTLLSLLLIPIAYSAQLTLVWNPNTEVDLAGYKIYYGTASRTYGNSINIGNVTIYTLTGLSAGQRYFIAVTAYNEFGESGYSNEVNGVAPTSQTPLNNTTEFVKQQYRDFLNREADSVGLQYWVDVLNSGTMTKAQVIDSFLGSQEFEGTIAPIVRLYFAYFLRIPDYVGLQYWVSEYSNGRPLGSISEYFAASNEFQQTYGSLTNEQFVTLVYQNILGRNTDPVGYAYWLGQLNSGTLTQGQVMLGFSESNEYKASISNEVFVTMMYIGMLQRSPEPGWFDYWVEYLDSGSPELSMIDAFFSSQEYASRFQ